MAGFNGSEDLHPKKEVTLSRQDEDGKKKVFQVTSTITYYPIASEDARLKVLVSNDGHTPSGRGGGGILAISSICFPKTTTNTSVLPRIRIKLQPASSHSCPNFTQPLDKAFNSTGWIRWERKLCHQHIAGHTSSLTLLIAPSKTNLWEDSARKEQSHPGMTLSCPTTALQKLHQHLRITGNEGSW